MINKINNAGIVLLIAPLNPSLITSQEQPLAYAHIPAVVAPRNSAKWGWVSNTKTDTHKAKPVMSRGIKDT
jgi:hypothetical protein